jgi:hypothetical protein
MNETKKIAGIFDTSVNSLLGMELVSKPPCFFFIVPVEE